MITIVIITFMMIIIAALASALISLVRDKGTTKRTIKALTWRISLSLLLFIFLLLAYRFHLISPHGIS